jgi:hypothetical protein
MKRLCRTGRFLAMVMATVLLTIEPYAVPTAYGQAPPNVQVPLTICGATGAEEPLGIGEPGPAGWANEQEHLNDPLEVRRYRFTVKEKGTAFVYVGDQWYNLNLGVFSLVSGSESCWSVEARGASTQSERRDLQFVRPDERAIDVEPGDYILTARAGDAMGFNASRNFTVRIAVTPGLCALAPANVPTEYPGMTAKPDNPDKFQVGVSFTPSEAELGPFALMSFNAYVSPPYTDLFDFVWELDGEVVAGETGPTFLKPYADLPKGPLGLHTVKLTAKGAREYTDPTDPQFNFTPFNGESRSVTCQFRGPS